MNFIKTLHFILWTYFLLFAAVLPTGCATKSGREQPMFGGSGAGGEGGVDEGDRGGQGQMCRDAGPLCDVGLLCRADVCQVDDSGQQGAACRDAAPLCDVGLLCQANVCQVDDSGQQGAACRDAAPLCDLGLVCRQHVCQVDNTGQLGQACRASAPLCAPGLLCENNVCELNEGCANSCEYGKQFCAEGNDEGYRVCGGRLEDDCTVLGGEQNNPTTVPCDGDRTCQNGICVSDQNELPTPEMAFVIDRGGFTDATWPDWRDVILTWSQNVQPILAVGAQIFPGVGANAECSLGEQARSSRNNTDNLQVLFNQPSPANASRPLFNIIGRSVQLLGRPSEGQFAVLITTGGETCDDPNLFVRRVRYLRGRGIKVRVLRVVLGGANEGEPIVELHEAGIDGGLTSGEDGGLGYANIHSPEELREELDRLARSIRPSCYDNDNDGFGYLCLAGSDCDDRNDAAYPGAPELCNQLDDDCDAMVDEEMGMEEGLLALQQQGVCAGSRQTCANGVWEEPDYTLKVANYEEMEVTCDGLNNDCDANVDEGISGPQGQYFQVCTVGVGECIQAGRFFCDVNVPDAPHMSVCTSGPGRASLAPLDPQAEVRDGLDNDCDGVVDNNLPAMPELCNGVDDDADGDVDEAFDILACDDSNERQVLGCVEGECVIACSDQHRNGPGADPNDLTCQTLGSYTDLALGNQTTCLLDPATSLAECYGGPNNMHAPVTDVGNYKKIAAGGRHVCLLVQGAGAQQAACFGPDADFLSLVPNNTEFLEIAAGVKYQQAPLEESTTACGLRADGQIECWSTIAEHNGVFPVLGNNNPNNPRGDRFVALTVGSQHICGIDNNGKASCWGECGLGECDSQSSAPQRPNFAQISAGDYHTCGVDFPLGYVYCWGAGQMPCVGPMEDCTHHKGQSIAPNTNGFHKVAAGKYHTCAIAADFSVQCWGLNEGGRTQPPEGKFTDIWAGTDHTCAKRVDGDVLCWGVAVGNETQTLR